MRLSRSILVTSLLISIFAISACYWPPRVLLYGWATQDQYWDAVWGSKWFAVMAAFSVFLCARVSTRYHWSLAAYLCYTMVSALWVFGWPDSYRHSDRLTLSLLKSNSTYAFCSLVVISTALMSFSRRSYGRSKDLLAALCLVNSLVVIAQWALGVPNGVRGGLFGNPSMSGCLIAFTYPMLALRKYRPPDFRWDYDHWDWIPYLVFAFCVIPLWAIYLIGASQPIGVLVVALIGYRISRFRQHLLPLLFMGAMAIAILVPLTTSKHGRSPFHDSGRLAVWQITMTPWWQTGRVWFGQGTGTAASIVPRLQAVEEATHHKPGEPFNVEEYHWLHSDWLQILFENGIIGFFLALTAAGFILRSAYRRSNELFSALLAYFATMFFNWPTHAPTHAVAGALLVGMASLGSSRYGKIAS